MSKKDANPVAGIEMEDGNARFRNSRRSSDGCGNGFCVSWTSGSLEPMPASSYTFPILKSVAELRDNKPCLLIDSREQTPLVFSRLPSRVATLQTGDYSIAGMEELFAVERKSIADLVACCMGDNRERFERELHRLRGYRFKRLLMIGSRELIEAQQYVSRISPRSVLGSVAAWEMRFDCPVVYCPSPELASREIERWAFYFVRELTESMNDLYRATVELQTEKE
jgi:DNA excision repair protein ERCC-4